MSAVVPCPSDLLASQRLVAFGVELVLSLHQLCRYVVFTSARQHVPQESNKLCLPFSHELPPSCESLVHTCIATSVQCLRHHEYKVHLRAERRVGSRCRRFFCRRWFQLVPLVHGSEIRSQCGGRRGILNLLHKFISRWSENRCQRPLKLLKSHVQLLDGHCHLLLWSRHGHSDFFVGTRCYLNSRIHRGCPRLIPSSATVTVRLLRFLSWQAWHQRLPELPAPRFPLGALRSTRQQVSIPVFRDAITVPLFREATILAPLPCCECMRWEVTYTHTCFALGECRIRVTHVHTRSDCVNTMDDTVRLNNASPFVRKPKK